MGILITVLALSTLALPGKACAFQKPRPGAGPRDISKLLERERREQGLPAVAAIVIQEDRIVATGYKLEDPPK